MVRGGEARERSVSGLHLRAAQIRIIADLSTFDGNSSSTLPGTETASRSLSGSPSLQKFHISSSTERFQNPNNQNPYYEGILIGLVGILIMSYF